MYTYIQQTDGTFTNQNFNFDVSTGNGSLIIKDINFDGINDIISYSNLGVEVFLCSANTTFTEVTLNQTIPGYSRGTFELADFNGDGVLDFYVDGIFSDVVSYNAKLFFGQTCPDGITTLLSISNNNGTLKPSAPQNQAATYRWFNCANMETTLGTDYTFTPTVAGEYGVDITLNSNCSGSADCFEFTIPTDDNDDDDNDDDDNDDDGESSVGISTLDFDNMKVFPNPSQSGIFTVEADNIISVTVTDLNGKTIFTATANNDKSFKIDLKDQEAGMYFMTLTTTSGKFAGKLIK